MYENIKTFEDYFEAREKLDKEYWKKVDALNDIFDRLISE